MNFHYFANIERAIKINNFLKIYTLNDIILQWVLGFVIKILKYFNKFVCPYIAYNQNMAKFSYGWSWKRLQNWKNEKV